MLERDLDDLFLRGVQVLLAVARARSRASSPDAASAPARRCATYRVAAGAWLMRVTVRAAVDRALRSAHRRRSRSLHDAGRALVAALRDALGSEAADRDPDRRSADPPVSRRARARSRLPPGVDDADRLVWTGNFVPAQREMIARDALRAAPTCSR